MTLRNQDYQAESAVADFLDRYFYPDYTGSRQRINDLEGQLKGIDVIAPFLGRPWSIDEKAAVHYVNKNLPTFAFELDFIGRDHALHEGWLYDDAKQTQCYLLSWIWAAKERQFSAKDITRLDVVLVSRAKIHEMLANHGLDKETAMNMAKTLRSQGQYGVHSKSAKPYYFYFTGHLFEKPINLILQKTALQAISMLHCTLRP